MMLALASITRSQGSKAMVDKAAGAFWTAMDGISKMWPVIVGLIVLIGGCYSLIDRVANMQSSLDAMSSLTSRVSALEADQANTAANFAPQVQALQSSQHDTNTALSTITQNIATLQAQMQFLINQNWPSAKVPK